MTDRQITHYDIYAEQEAKLRDALDGARAAWFGHDDDDDPSPCPYAVAYDTALDKLLTFVRARAEFEEHDEWHCGHSQCEEHERLETTLDALMKETP